MISMMSDNGLLKYHKGGIQIKKMQEIISSLNALIPINNTSYEKIIIEKLRSSENIYDILAQLNDEKISILVQYFLNKSHPESNEEYFQLDYIKILVNTLIFRLRAENLICSSVLSNISYSSLKQIYKYAPFTVLENSFNNLVRSQYSKQEIQLLNENPIFFKNKFMKIFFESPKADLSHFTTKIWNLKALGLIAKEMDYNAFLWHFQPQRMPYQLIDQFRGSEDVLHSDNISDSICEVVTPYILLNSSITSVNKFLGDAPNSVLKFVTNSIVKLMGMKRYPIQYIPISSNICVHRDMNLINLIKDDQIVQIQAGHICTNYLFAIDRLLDTLYASNKITGFIQNYGFLLHGSKYVVSQMALKSCQSGDSSIEDWSRYIAFDDRVAADIASVLLKHIPHSIKTLCKLSESGSITFQTIGNALFTDVSLWTQFCEYYADKYYAPQYFAVLCFNILNCDQRESALKAVSIAAKYIFRGDSTNGKGLVFSVLINSLDTVILKEDYMTAFVKAFISYHPLSSYLLPLEEIIQKCCKTCFFQIIRILHSELSNPKILLFKMRLFNYRYQQDPQQHALHFINSKFKNEY